MGLLAPTPQVLAVREVLRAVPTSPIGASDGRQVSGSRTGWSVGGFDSSFAYSMRNVRSNSDLLAGNHIGERRALAACACEQPTLPLL